MARAFAEHEANLPVGDTLGQTLIPVINKLQDVFAQVRGVACVVCKGGCSTLWGTARQEATNPRHPSPDATYHTLVLPGLSKPLITPHRCPRM